MPMLQPELGPNGWMFLLDFEGGPDGGMALDAYTCPAGEPTLLFGITHYPDGRRVKMGDKCTVAEAESIQRGVLKVYETGIWEALPDDIKPQLNQNQFDALVMAAYNLGVPMVTKKSEFFRLICEGRFAQAEAAFGNFDSYRTYAPTRRQIQNPAYRDITGRNDKGHICWTSPDGRPCRYRQKSRGVLRRNLSHACLFAGYSWREACSVDRIHCVPEPPDKRFWNDRDGCWEDRLHSKTRWADVRPMAEHYPLATIEWDPANEPPFGDDDVDVELPDFELPEQELPVFELEPPEPMKPAPPVATKLPAPPVKLPTEADPKDMILSRRFWGHVLVLVGSANAWIAGILKNEAARELLIWCGIIAAGFLLRWLGERYAKRALA